MKPSVLKDTVTPEATLSPEVMEAMKLVSPVLGGGGLELFEAGGGDRGRLGPDGGQAGGHVGGAPFVVTVTTGRISSGCAGSVMTRSLPSTV